jgi:hypothetical protein
VIVTRRASAFNKRSSKVAPTQVGNLRNIRLGSLRYGTNRPFVGKVD